MKQQSQALETNLANVLIGELARSVPKPPGADASERFPLIEILREATFTIDDAATTMKLPPRGVFVDVDNTVPQPLYSSPYERIDVGVELAPPRRPRNRPATIARRAPVGLRKSAPTPITTAEHVAITRPMPRFSEPYERVEIIEPRTPSSGSSSFEAAWFSTEAPAEYEESAEKPWWLAIAIAACVVAAALVMIV